MVAAILDKSNRGLSWMEASPNRCHTLSHKRFQHRLAPQRNQRVPQSDTQVECFFSFSRLLSYERGLVENEKPTIGTRPVGKQLKREIVLRCGAPADSGTGPIAERIAPSEIAPGRPESVGQINRERVRDRV